ncbi:MAG: hypothetical protein AB3X44_16230 [Leptothrix sp. (in: b-proteobacteria)]
MARLGSQSDLARELNITRQTVNRHVKNGLFAPLANGKFDLDYCRTVHARDTDKTQRLRAMGGRATVHQTDDTALPSGANEMPRVSTAVVQGGAWLDETEGDSFIAAKTRRERLLGDLAEMDAAERRGQLVLKADVDRALAAKLLSLRERLLTLPDRILDYVLAAESKHEARLILERELTQALADVARSEMQPLQ